MAWFHLPSIYSLFVCKHHPVFPGGKPPSPLRAQGLGEETSTPTVTAPDAPRPHQAAYSPPDHRDWFRTGSQVHWSHSQGARGLSSPACASNCTEGGKRRLSRDPAKGQTERWVWGLAPDYFSHFGQMSRSNPPFPCVARLVL